MPPRPADVAICGARSPALSKRFGGEREPGIECATSSSCRQHIASRRDDGRAPARRSRAADGRPANEPRRGAAPTTLRPNSSRCPRRLHLGHARTGPSCADSRPHVPTPVPGHPGSYGQLPPQASPPVTVGDAWHDGDSSSPPHTDHSAAWLTPHEQPRPTEPDELRQCRPSHDCL